LLDFLAAVTPDRKKWDAYMAHDTMVAFAEMELRHEHAWSVDEVSNGYPTPHEFWNEFVADDRAHLTVIRSIPFDRLLAIDIHGDGYYPIPHVFVEFDETHGPFSPGSIRRLEYPGGYGPRRIDIDPTKENRAEIFPRELPSLVDSPPKAFDQTLEDVQPLTGSTDDMLRRLLSSLRDEPKERNPSPESKTPSDEPARKRATFTNWCIGVAQPVFSAFVRGFDRKDMLPESRCEQRKTPAMIPSLPYPCE
jgi:hypothetical protein